MLPGCQTKKRRRKRVHGFLKRQRTAKKVSIIQKRRRKGRKKLTV